MPQTLSALRQGFCNGSIRGREKIVRNAPIGLPYQSVAFPNYLLIVSGKVSPYGFTRYSKKIYKIFF
jgi:hypothetical protein